MPAQLRVLRRRIRSVESTKKITRAQELIASSRIVKAQRRVEQARPYARRLLAALENVAASTASLDHPLLSEPEAAARSAVILVTSDRGFAGAYSTNAIREGERLAERLRAQSQDTVPYLVGKKGISFYRFRGRELAGEWTGFTEEPSFEDAAQIGSTVLEAFLADGDEGVDEVHIVYTHFVSSVRQEVRARRLLPLVVEEDIPGEDVPLRDDERPPAREQEGPLPLLDFEPSAEEVLDALLPRYLNVLVYDALLMSAASQLAARRRAMKAATDNASDLVKALTREANAARQAEITNEISEIVGGADALASSAAE